MSYLLKLYDMPLVEFDLARNIMGVYSFQILNVFSSADIMPYPIPKRVLLRIVFMVGCRVE